MRPTAGLRPAQGASAPRDLFLPLDGSYFGRFSNSSLDFALNDDGLAAVSSALEN